MNDAPETIWAWDYEDVETGITHNTVSAHNPTPILATEYHRTDLLISTAQLEADPRVKALVEALAECKHITHKSYISATMQAINAGPAHPLSKQIDAWRLRCLRAEEQAHTALAQLKEPKPWPVKR
jgi:hypothetical protein